MMNRLFLFCLFLCLGTYAQSLNLEQARLLALANSRSLARYELSIRSSILDEKNQLYALFPTVSAGYRASMNYLHNGEFVNPIDTLTAGVNFSITQIIFQGGKSFIQRAISSISTESIRKDALAEYFNVIDAVDNAYYAVLEAQAALEAEESSLEAANFSLIIAEIRHSNGIINTGDYLKALADKEARENSRNQVRRNLTLSIARLRSLTGFTGDAVFEQIDFSMYEQVLLRLSGISDGQADALYRELWNILLAANPSLAKAALSNQIAERNLTLARRDFSPTVSATVFSSTFNYSTAGGFSMGSSGGLTISGSIPVDFWMRNNRIEKSQIARDSAALSYIGAESSLETELQSALLNAITQAGAVLSARRSLEYTERHFEYVMERYRLSQSSVSDLSESTTLLINSRNSHTRASYGFLQSISRIRSLCAIDNEERLLEIFTGRM